MPGQPDPRSAARERMSSLADGALDAHAVASACALWRADADARATWHAYHLIGDVLRSDDLAHDASTDASFMHALRSRLADEPTVLAPRPLVPAEVDPAAAAAAAAAPGRGGRWGWLAPSAVAAGFVAVAGVLMITRMPDNAAGAGAAVASLASIATPATPSASALVLAAPAVGDAQALAGNGQFVRDAQLDRYLAAHKQFAGSSALGVPSGFLRAATVEMAGR